LIVLWYKTNQVTSINEPKARTRLTPVSLIIKDSKDIIASANPHRSNPKGLVEYDLVGDDKIEDLFYLVHIAGKGNTGIAIAPGRDLAKYSQLLPENTDLYNQLADWQNRIRSSF